jgi:SpoVK/Ycf46/Vps4 family AAA+-type ATPase
MANNEFIKIGENIVAKPKGADYDLIPGKVYNLSWNRWEDSPIFKENGELNLPKKVYSTKTDDIFKKRIITYFNKANTNTTGVMLAGVKGTGKTVMMKLLAKESGLPIIVVNPDYPEGKLIKFFKSFTTPVCVLFDEVEKNFKTEYMLDFLDGVEKTTQKLVIMTCNDLSQVSQYMQDRCSRIRYLRRYSPDENAAFLPMLADDFGIKNKEEVVKFCKENIKLLSMDNIISFMSEVKMLEDEDISLQEIINIMNISTENIPTKVSDTVEYDDECDDCDECNDVYDDYECCDAA